MRRMSEHGELVSCRMWKAALAAVGDRELKVKAMGVCSSETQYE